MIAAAHRSGYPFGPSASSARGDDTPPSGGSRGGATHAPRPLSIQDRDRLVRSVIDKRYSPLLRGRTWTRSSDELPDMGSGVAPGEMVDLLFAGPGEPRLPDETFHRLQWGGLFIFVSPQAGPVERLADAYRNRRGFLIEHEPQPLSRLPFGLSLPWLPPRAYYFAARKVELIQEGEVTERFTYHVYLQPDPDEPEGYVVVKEVPGHANLLYRLKKKFPNIPEQDLDKRAHKLAEHVFPTFLTREAAMLKLLQRDMPERFRNRVPRLISAVQDEKGFVHRLSMNWLRIGGEPMSQLDFARQAAELLVALHEEAKIIHLDLRLDNFTITPDGVGFVDFGSAVRMGETFKSSPMLGTLFEEMMRTSQIQRMLGKMLERGDVTSRTIASVHGKVDKTVDSFYLAVQINKPESNPELRHLIRHEPGSLEARSLAALTAAILRPKTPGKEEFRSAADILRGLSRIETKLGRHQERQGRRRRAA